MRMKAGTFVLGALLVASFASLAQAQGPSGPTPPSPGHVTVGWDDTAASVEYQRYLPATLVVQAGDTVTWVAGSESPHTVTSYPPGGNGSFDSSADVSLGPEVAAVFFGPGAFLNPGQSFNRTFDQPGVYAYFCKIHPGMHGTVTVTNGTGAQNPLPVGPQAGTAGGNATVYVTAGWGSGETSVDRFGPGDIRVATGTTVVWTNMHSSEPHTVTGIGPNGQLAFDSSPGIQGDPPGFSGAHGVLQAHGNNTQFTHTFDAAGTWVYFCKLHAGMWGTVVVLPADKDGDGSTTGGSMQGGATGGTTGGATKD
ncbi:MAG: hypothetical protein LC624_06390, partial [Halobacteriales archaeon]|nr:hypothetical protein [Halobacteriales archaeon]